MRILAVILSFALVASAQPKPTTTEDATPGHLPVKRVVLYKNGVGYFEHVGRVRGTQDVNIDFTTSQLDDVLKSLTIVDLGEGRVTGVRYNSTAPLDQRLRGLRLPLGEQPTREQLLNALRGARVEVRNGSASAIGKILSVETRERKNSRTDETIQTTELALITDSGELRTFEINPGTTVRIAEADLARELNRYLGMVSSSRAKDVRRMTISATGTGDRDLFVSYISEVPIWKTTYRIVIPTDSSRLPLLQGWAVVDNTIGEDWKDVKLSLVAGAPQSFVQNLSTPYYARRPVIGLPQTAQLAPQTHQATVELSESHVDSLVSPKGIVGGVPGGVRGGSIGGMIGSGSGAGIGAGRGFTAPSAPPPPPAPGTNEFNVAKNSYMESQFESASGREIGELFSYDLKQPITIGKDQSALVPIVQARIEAQKVTLWNERERTPRNALWMRNTSGATLDSGSFSIVEGNSFAGEGLLEPIKPDERRLLSYAGDSSIRITSQDESDPQPISRVRIVRGLMTVTRQERAKKTFTIHNSDKEARNVVIEHPARQGWKFIDGIKPEESTESLHRFLVKVEPNSNAKLEIAEFHPLETRVYLTNLTSDDVILYSRQRVLKPEIETAFRKILDQKNQIAGFDQQISLREQEVNSISADQDRVRENMKALKGSAEEKSLLQRYATQLNSQEDRLIALRKEVDSIRSQREQANKELTRTLMDISFDEEFAGQ
ncbi:MAG TPA: hypothetical protein VN577_22760 [Terriglobales bacterium]|nr:hypothetical protein [Terriglobales bacterium]